MVKNIMVMTRSGRAAALIFILALLASASTLEAKSNGRISGKVTGKDGQGLLGAVITILKQDTEGGTISFTRSDRRGVYSLGNIVPGSYYLQVSRQGYQPLDRADVRIDSGKTTTLDVILQEFFDFVVAGDDPRNWDFKTVLRSTSDRRLIFRYLEGGNVEESRASSSPPFEGFLEPKAFTRSGMVNVTSSAGLSSENYSVFPSNGRNGLVSNFAFAEPVGEHGRVIFSGQLNSGYDSLWRVRNTYQYRPETGRDLKLSLGYGRLNLNGPSMASVGRPAEFFTRDSALRESGVQTVGLGLEARSTILDPIVAEYGFDLSRVYYGVTKSTFSPFFQLTITPAETWTVKAALASRRMTDSNTVILPDGELVNVLEPTYIAQIDGDIHVSQYKHQEIAVAKAFPNDTSLELALYEDRMEGAGTPVLVSRITERGSHSTVTQLGQDQSTQHGMRFAVNRQFLDFLRGSIAYVYGTGTGIANADEAISSEALTRDLLHHMQRSYYHAFTSQLDAAFPRTRTYLTSVVRWYPRSTLTPIDLFADRKDTLTKGVSFFVRQAIPLPEFLGTAGRWEALLDVRNLLDQGKDRFRTTDGELILTRNPRSFRFGLNLNLY